MLKFFANSRWRPPNQKYIYLRVRLASNEIPKTIPMFLGFPTQLCYMHHHRKLFSAENPRWRPPNRKYPCFCRCPTQLYYIQCHRKLFSAQKSKMAAAKPEILLYQLSDELETKFQRLYPCFLGCPTQLFYRRKFSAANPRWCPENRNSYRFNGTLSTSCNLPVSELGFGGLPTHWCWYLCC